MLNVVLVLLVLFFSVCTWAKMVQLHLEKLENQIQLNMGVKVFGGILTVERMIIYAIAAIVVSCIKVGILYWIIQLIAG